MFQWLFNLFGIFFGLGLGCLVGISVGPYIFPALTKPKDYRFLDEAADHDDDMQVTYPQGSFDSFPFCTPTFPMHGDW